MSTTKELAAVGAPAPAGGGSQARMSGRVLCLIGGPYVVHNRRQLPVPEGSKRLLAFVALRGGHVDRRQTAGTLWPRGNDERAGGNLRSALWRLKGAGIDVLQSDKCALWLDPAADLDLRDIEAWATRLIQGAEQADDLQIPECGPDAIDLLPGWYDDWVIFERERLRQLVLHALESLSGRLIEAERYAEAIEAALLTIRVEPLRESAQRALLKAHLAEGNLDEARRAFDKYRTLVARELGVYALPGLAALLAGGSGRNNAHVPTRTPPRTLAAPRWPR